MELDFLSKMTIENICDVTVCQKCKSKKGTLNHNKHWKLFIKQTGVTQYTCKTKKIISDPTHAVLIPPGIFCTWENLIMGDYSYISFVCNLKSEHIIQLEYNNTNEILKKLRLLERIFTVRKPFFQMESIKETYDIILELIKSENKIYSPSKTRLRLEPAIDYIASNYTHNISMKHLAELTGVSLSHFRKIFSTVYGMSPKAYIQNIRMEKAKSLLVDSDISITETAFEVGYQNIYDFSRAFKKKEGISPLQYKNIIR